jgi:hypothetical protein
MAGRSARGSRRWTLEPSAGYSVAFFVLSLWAYRRDARRKFA